jgi:UDP-2,3-diacylglucosamine hydrolase
MTRAQETEAGPLGLIAGNGVFPLLVARGARDAGVRVVAVAHLGETEEEIAELVEACTWVRVGELGKIIKTFKQAGCTRAVLAGGIKKARLFRGFRPDLRGAAFLARVRSLHDDRLLRGIADELESEGMRVIASTDYMPSLVPAEGPLTRRALRSRERADVEFGLAVAKGVGRFEIGQTVVVKDGLVLAVEAVEGTDEAIRRGGQLARGGAVVVKVSKPGQDLRFDVPAVGPETIRLMAEVGATVLALEAGHTIVLEREETIAAADRAGLAIVAVAAPHGEPSS